MPAYPGCAEKRPLNRCVVVAVDDAVLDGGASRVGVDKCVLSAMLVAMMMRNIIEEFAKKRGCIF